MTARNRKYLVFSLHDSLYALDLDQVAEVGDPPEMCPIPFAPSCYSGAFNFHGDIMAVLDLAVVLGLPADGHPSGKIVILHQQTASLAFLVDTVVRIVSEEEVTFSPLSDVVPGAAELCFADSKAVMLDPETLLLEAETCLQRKW